MKPDRRRPGTGIGRMSADGESADHQRIIDAWEVRCKRHVPGIRSLGPEFGA